MVNTGTFIKCEALLGLGFSARRTYALTSTWFTFNFKTLDSNKRLWFSYVYAMSLCTPIFKTPYSRFCTVNAIKGGESSEHFSLSETSRLEGSP